MTQYDKEVAFNIYAKVADRWVSSVVYATSELQALEIYYSSHPTAPKGAVAEVAER